MSYGELKIDTITFTAGGVDTSVSVSGLVQNPTFTGNITTTGTISGDVVRGNTVSGATVTGDTGEFGNLTAVSGVFTTQVSGATVTGNVGLFTTITGGIHTLTSGVFASGTAANPSITFVDDLDTGLFTGAANTVSLVASGVAVLTASGTSVGVGTTSPDGKLHVSEGVSGANASVNSDTLFLENNGQAGITIGTPNNTLGQIRFADPENDTAGRISYEHYNDAMAFTVNNAERARIDSSGRLGIGTSSPGAALEVHGSSTARFFGGSATDATLAIGSTGAANDAVIIKYDNANDRLQFYNWGSSVSNQNTFVIDNANARVGIGTTSPTTTLSVKGASIGTGIDITHVDGGGGAEVWKLQSGISGVNHGYFALNQGATTRITVSDAGLVGIGTNNPGAKLHLADSGASSKIRIAGNSTSAYTEIYGDNVGNLIFSADPGNSGSSSTIRFTVDGPERARIDSSGRLLVGTTTSQRASALAQVYEASGTVDFLCNSGSLGNSESAKVLAVGGARTATLGCFKHASITNPAAYIYLQEEDGTDAYYWTDNSGNLRISSNANHIGTTSGTVVGTQTSDERIKNILGPVEYGLHTLKQIEPIRYSLKSEPNTEKLGFIAQQVQPLVPQSVFDTGDHIEGEPEDAPTKLGMEYVALIPVLVNAIKELSAEVDALKAQLQVS